MRVAIIGAGMAGLACADALSASGHSVVLFDKGRGPGGRMSTRHIATADGDVSLDHGAQYFTVRDPRFALLVDQWAKDGVAAPWPLAGPDCWIGTPTMNNVIRAMASRHEVRFSTQVRTLHRREGLWWLDADAESFDLMVLAVPAEQSVPLLSLHDLAMARIAGRARSQPCWTALLVFEHRLELTADIVRNEGLIAWAARNSAKPGRSGVEAWVVQASATWSEQHLEDDPDAVVQHLSQALALAAACPLPPLSAATAHRWRFALSAGLGIDALWNNQLRLGVCGDWLQGPRVECAWQSGQELASMMSCSALAGDAVAPALDDHAEPV